MRLLIGQRQKSDIETLLSNARENSDISSLHLFKIEIDEQVGNLLVELLMTSQQRSRTWERIQFELCTGNGLQRVMDAVLSVSSVERVVWNGENFPMHQDSSQHIPQTLTLQSVHLTPSNSRFLEKVLQRNVHALELTECQIEDTEVAHSIAEGLRHSSSLERLNLSNCNLDESTTALFLDALKSHVNLKELDLSHNRCGDVAMSALADLLESSTTLTKLCMTKAVVSSSSDSNNNMATLFKALERNTSLTFLTLPHNHIDSDGMKALAVSLTRNKTLKTLYLHDNSIDNDGISHILSVWQQWSLHTLWLFGNPIVDGVQRLADAFTKQTQLQSLEIPKMGPNHKLLWKYQQQMNYWGGLNKGGRRLLREEEAPLGLWPLVLARANRFAKQDTNGFSVPDVLYHLLQGQPAMFQRA